VGDCGSLDEEQWPYDSEEGRMKTYVLYHGGCWDGFCAAWVARRHLPADTEYIPVQYWQPEPQMECNSMVYLLDFSYKRPEMRNMLSQMHLVIVLDHHKTAETELAGLVDEFTMRPDLINNIPGSRLPLIHFDMSKSGGRLTWEHFHGSVKPNWLVEYTEDRDLWRWKLDWSKEINAWLRSFPLDFELWDDFSLVGPGCGAWDMRIDSGTSIIRRESQIVDEHVRHAREIEMAGHKILAVNATVLFSDIAGELAKDRPFGACYFDNGDGLRVWSLRSRDGGIDVSEVARQFGGGGHRNAAGFEETIR
jgi:oligoribonuclease NrnB/cAMP/cGMP phosphodiesterase (DHH superfamily)